MVSGEECDVEWSKLTHGARMGTDAGIILSDHLLPKSSGMFIDGPRRPYSRKSTRSLLRLAFDLCFHLGSLMAKTIGLMLHGELVSAVGEKEVGGGGRGCRIQSPLEWIPPVDGDFNESEPAQHESEMGYQINTRMLAAINTLEVGH